MTQTLNRMYEGMFLADSAMASADWEAMLETINTIFNRAQAEVVSVRKWDDRRLCYEIKGHKRGIYILSYFKADPRKITQIERDVQISESILRVLILKADHLTEQDLSAPTPAMLADHASSFRDDSDNAYTGEGVVDSPAAEVNDFSGDDVATDSDNFEN